MSELEQVWTVAFRHLLIGTMFLVPVALAAHVFRHASPRVLDALYSIGALKLALPLSLIAPWLSLPWRGLAASGDSWGIVPAPAVALIVGPGLESGSITYGPGWGLIIWTTIWALGAGWCLARLVRRAMSARQAHEQGAYTLSMNEAAALRDALAAAELAPHDVQVSSDGSGPYVRGLVRPRIVVPATFLERVEVDELCAALLHERQHLRRHDPLRYAALGVVRALLWFYPPIWWLARKIRETTEMACDEAVVRAGVPAEAFRRSLAHAVDLGLDDRGARVPVGMLGHRGSCLRRRLQRITQHGRWPMTKTQRMTTLGLALGAFALSTIPAGPPAGDTVSTTRVYAGPDAPAPPTAPSAVSPVSPVSPPASAPKPLLVGQDGVSAPRRLPTSTVAPVYPESARREKLESRLILQAVIDAQGRVGEIVVLSNSAGLGEFEKAAIEAVRQWRYEPAKKDGKPVEAYFTIRVDFTLDPGKGEQAPVADSV